MRTAASTIMGYAGPGQAQRLGLPILGPISTAVIDEAKIGGSQPRPRDSVGWLTGSIAQLQMSMSEYQDAPDTCHDPVVRKDAGRQIVHAIGLLAAGSDQP